MEDVNADLNTQVENAIAAHEAEIEQVKYDGAIAREERDRGGVPQSTRQVESAPVEEENDYVPTAARYMPPVEEYHGPTIDEVENLHEYHRLVVHDAKTELRQELNEQQLNHNVLASEQHARRRYADYDQTIKPVEEAIKTNPRVFELLRELPDPGGSAYMLGQLFNYAQMRAASGQRPVATPRYINKAAYDQYSRMTAEDFDKLSGPEFGRILRACTTPPRGRQASTTSRSLHAMQDKGRPGDNAVRDLNLTKAQIDAMDPATFTRMLDDWKRSTP